MWGGGCWHHEIGSWIKLAGFVGDVPGVRFVAGAVDMDVKDCLVLILVVGVGSLALLSFPLGDVVEPHGELAQGARLGYLLALNEGGCHLPHGLRHAGA